MKKSTFRYMLYACMALIGMALPMGAENVGAGGDVTVVVPRFATAKDSVPAVPVMTLGADAGKGPYVKIVINVPTKDKAGNPVSAVTKMTLYRANAVYRTLVPEQGQSTITLFDTVPVNHKSYQYGITATNSYGTSARANKTVYVGVQKPRNPLNVIITPDYSNHRKGHVTWMPPELDAGNQPVDPASLTYKVSMRSNSGVLTVVKDSIRELGCDFEYTGEGYDLFSIIVTASNAGGVSSNGTSANRIFLGEPISVNMSESFANGKAKEPLFYGYEAAGGAISWMVCNDDVITGLTGCDNDHGYMAVLGAKERIGLLKTNYIDVGKFSNPWACMYLYKAEQQADVEVQMMAVVDSTSQVIKTLNLKDLPIQGWNPVGVDLAPFKGKLVQLGLRILFNADNAYFQIDNLRIGDATIADLAIGSISVPENIHKGLTDSISAIVSNCAVNPSSPYSVELLRNGVTVLKRNMPPLNGLEAVKVVMPDNLSVAGADSLVYYTMTVLMNGDVNHTNDSTETFCSQAVPSVLPVVRELRADNSASTITLSWEAPDMTRMPANAVVETFENYDPFSDNIGQWRNIDGDARNVGGFSVNGNKLPLTGKHGFFIMDNDTFPSRDLAPRPGGGRRYAASLYTNDGKPVDDWLISPQLNGCAQLMEMYVLAYFKFEVPWQVLYSTTGRDTTDFVLLKADSYKRDWKKFSYLLPEGTKYFAIRAVHVGPVKGPYSPLFCFDDVKYIPAGPGYGKLLGYNVYCEDRLLTPQPVSATAFQHKADLGTHTYKVSAVYDRGESMPVQVLVSSATGNLSGEDFSVWAEKEAIIIETPTEYLMQVYNLQGMRVMDANLSIGCNRIPIPKGYYIVRIADKTFKIIVR